MATLYNLVNEEDEIEYDGKIVLSYYGEGTIELSFGKLGSYAYLNLEEAEEMVKSLKKIIQAMKK